MLIPFTCEVVMMTVKPMVNSAFDRVPFRRLLKQEELACLARPLHKRRGVGAG